MEWSPNNLILLLLGISTAFLISLSIYLKIRKNKKLKDKQVTSSKSSKKFERRNPPPDEFIKFLFLFPDSFLKWFRNAILFYLTIPLMIVGCAYFIRLSSFFYGFGWPYFISSNLIWIFAIGLFTSLN